MSRFSPHSMSRPPAAGFPFDQTFGFGRRESADPPPDAANLRGPKEHSFHAYRRIARLIDREIETLVTRSLSLGA